MPSTFVNPVVNPDQQLGVNVYTSTAPVRHWPADAATSSVDELDAVIRAIYKQVLGNAYVMESERQQIPESQFRRGEFTVIEFIRKIALSDLYRSRFFENGPRNRFIELNFKHLLGRAPESLAEVAYHSALLDKEGYEAEIDSYLDSDEYYETFGADTVPYYRGYKTEGSTKLMGFTHMFKLLRGASSSDKHVTANNPARLTQNLFANAASPIISPTGAANRQGRSSSMSTDDWIRSVLQRSTTPSVWGGSDSQSVSQGAPLAGGDNSELAVKARSQADTIEQLEQQLSELRSLSNMGACILRKGQRPPAPSAEQPFGSRQSSIGMAGLQQQVEAQSEKIERLRGELMTARSMAAIAESKLNKWRARSY